MEEAEEKDMQAALSRKLAQIRREAEERMARNYALKHGYQYVDLNIVVPTPEAVKMIPETDARAAWVVGIQLKQRDFALAAVDPENEKVKAITETLHKEGYRVKIVVSSRSNIETAWRLYKFGEKSPKRITGKVEITESRLSELVNKLTSIEEVSAAIAAVDFANTTTSDFFEVILVGAFSNRVSDIHLEGQEKDARIRYRIDGLLHDISTNLPAKMYNALVSRIKLLSGMKINIKGEAQDGRFTAAFGKKEVEMRVSIIPAEFGETVVMRVLDPDSINIDLPKLGLREDDLELVEKNLARPNGLILNTGPTGSGKTTTLYAFLRYLNKTDVKIITVEDPIEYHLRGISQTQVDSAAGYTFASGLRSILRQDPDVILVGEVRDQETADIALQAALTGHVVLSTLHTNDAIGAVPRLIDLGVRPAAIGPALSLVIAQRLVRRLCSECKKPIVPPAELKEKIDKFLEKLPQRVNREKYKEPKLFEAQGCKACNSFGYRGRIGIYEFLETSPEMEEVILKEPSWAALRRLADKSGMVTMQQDGILKVLEGITSFEEVEEATGKITW